MDLDQSLIKSILQKLENYLKLSNDDSLISDMSNTLKNCNYSKLKKLSKQLFHDIEIEPERTQELLKEFQKEILENCKFKTHKIINGNEENICLSSDDDIESHMSSSSLLYTDDEATIKPQEINDNNGLELDDSDIEIIYEKESISCDNGANRYNTRKRGANNSKENISNKNVEPNHKQARYDFRERKSNLNPGPNKTNLNQSKNEETNSKEIPSKDLPQESEVIQIEDSSSDEDVQEIHCESGTSNNYSQGRNKNPFNHSNRRQSQNFFKPSFKANCHNDQPPTQPDPSQLASIPLIVQFPTMQSATFNGHLYISHNHKFSVKLQGVDPRNFRWN